MTEMQTGRTAGAGRTYGMVIGRDEPSHIHLPRRRRVRPDGQNSNPTWPADVGADETGTTAPSTSTEV